MKKTRQSSKKTKTTNNVPATSAPINIHVASYQPMTHFQRTMKNVKRKVLDDLKDYFDDFNYSEKEEIEQEVIKYLCDNDRSLIDIKSVVPNSLYNYLDNKWHIVIEKEQEIREEIFCPVFS